MRWGVGDLGGERRDDKSDRMKNLYGAALNDRLKGPFDIPWTQITSSDCQHSSFSVQ